MANDLVLSDREELFINSLIESGGDVAEASEKSGYGIKYCYILRTKLAKHITAATHAYMVVRGSVKAAKYTLDALDGTEPINPNRIAVAKDILDRTGVKVMAEEEEKQVIKANIFILPEKKYQEIIDTTYEISKGV